MNEEVKAFNSIQDQLCTFDDTVDEAVYFQFYPRSILF